MKFTMQDNTGVPVGGYAAEYVALRRSRTNPTTGPQ